MSSKTVIRKEYLAIRKNLVQERRTEACLAATKKLLEVVSGLSCILSFASKEQEIDLWPLNKELAREKRLLLPKMVSESEILPFQVKDLNKELVSQSDWDVLEPNPKLCKKIADLSWRKVSDVNVL